MIRYLIKNNLKLMSRNKAIFAIMVFGPVFVIGILSSAFDNLMKSYEGTDKFQAGYQVESGSFWENNIETIKEAGKKAGIEFLEYPDGNPGNLLKNNILAAFVKLGNQKYTIYENADKETEGMVLEYFLGQCLKQNKDNTAGAGILVQELDYMPAVSAKDYYGISEIVYFGFLGIICMASVFASEKKNGIERRLQITSLSCFKLYFAKWLPAVAVVITETGIAVALSSVLFGIHWGNFIISAIIVILLVMAGISAGLMLYTIFKNIAVTVVVLFTLTFFMNFLGGAFETYMYSSYPEAVKSISPIYHVNRALVEHSCMGHSGYTLSSILYLVLIIIICTGIAVLAGWKGKKGREER